MKKQAIHLIIVEDTSKCNFEISTFEALEMILYKILQVASGEAY
jgi:hypothetical protein